MRSSKVVSNPPAARRLSACLCAALGFHASAALAREATHRMPAFFAPVTDAPRLAGAGLHARAARASKASAPAGAVLFVTNCNDSGPGSLRDAALAATDRSTIDLRALSCSTITLANGAVNFPIDNVSIYGPGSGRFTIVGNGQDRIFGHGGAGQLTIRGLTLTGGAIRNSAGGCVYSSAHVNLGDTVISSCRTDAVGNYIVEGGGVYTRGSLVMHDSKITNCVVDSPTSDAFGGGAFVRGNLEVVTSTISDNVASGYLGNTGGIAALGDVTIAYSTISGNQATVNAGLALFAPYATGPLKIGQTTISGNVATGIIGGVGVLADTKIYNSTIANNRDGGGSIGAGLFAGTGIAIGLYSTIVADNFSGSVRDDVGGYAGASLSGAQDLIMASTLPVPAGTLASDPLLGPLADHGGRTFTQALLSGSPAIGAGSNAQDFKYDQRIDGAARLVGAALDIGAYEVQSTGTVRPVTNCNATGSGSLNDAAAHAYSGDTIDLTALSCGTITLSDSLITGGNLTLLGPGADRLTIDGNHAHRIVYHPSYGTLRFSGLTLANGYYAYNGNTVGGCVASISTVVFESSRATGCKAVCRSIDLAYGGALSARRLEMTNSVLDHNEGDAPGGNAVGGAAFAYDAHISDSTISGNTGTVGGGIYVSDQAVIERSTISGNVANLGGGVFLHGAGEIVDTTISGNEALGFVGGLLAEQDLSLYNSTVAFNTGGVGYRIAAGVAAQATARLHSAIVFGNVADENVPYDVGTTAGGTPSIAGSHNLIGSAGVTLPIDTIFSDPLLAPLADNGGPTWTHALQRGSPAIDVGDNVFQLDTDQRGSGFAREVDDGPDIGAFEVQPDQIFRDGFDFS